MDPLDVQVERTEERRGLSERMDRRADIVDEAGQRQLGRAEAAAELGLRLVDLDREPGPGERDRRREAVRAGTDHDGAFHVRQARNNNRGWSSTRQSGARTRTRYGSG